MDKKELLEKYDIDEKHFASMDSVNSQERVDDVLYHKEGLAVDPFIIETPIARTELRLQRGVNRWDKIKVNYSIFTKDTDGKRHELKKKLVTSFNDKDFSDAGYSKVVHGRRTSVINCPTPYIYTVLPAVFKLWKEQGFGDHIFIPSTAFLIDKIMGGRGDWLITFENLLALKTIILSATNVYDVEGENESVSFSDMFLFKEIKVTRVRGSKAKENYNKPFVLFPNPDFTKRVRDNLINLDYCPDLIFKLKTPDEKRLMMYIDKRMGLDNRAEELLILNSRPGTEGFRQNFLLPKDDDLMLAKLHKIYDTFIERKFLKKIGKGNRIVRKRAGLYMRFERPKKMSIPK